MFQKVINIKARCFKCKGYKHYDYQYSSKSQHIRIMPSNNVDDSKVVKNVNILSEITSIIEDALVDSSTLIIDEATCLLMVLVK